MITHTIYRIATEHPAPEFRLRDHLITVNESDGVVSIDSPSLGCSRDYHCSHNRAINLFIAEHGMSLLDLEMIPDRTDNKMTEN